MQHQKLATAVQKSSEPLLREPNIYLKFLHPGSVNPAMEQATILTAGTRVLLVMVVRGPLNTQASTTNQNPQPNATNPHPHLQLQQLCNQPYQPHRQQSQLLQYQRIPPQLLPLVSRLSIQKASSSDQKPYLVPHQWNPAQPMLCRQGKMQ